MIFQLSPNGQKFVGPHLAFPLPSLEAPCVDVCRRPKSRTSSPENRKGSISDECVERGTVD